MKLKMFILHPWYDRGTPADERKRLEAISRTLRASRIKHVLGMTITPSDEPIILPIPVAASMTDRVLDCSRVHVIGAVDPSPWALAVIGGLTEDAQEGKGPPVFGHRWPAEQKHRAAEAASRDVLVDGWAIVDSECLLETIIELASRGARCTIRQAVAEETWRVELGEPPGDHGKGLRFEVDLILTEKP